MDYTTQRLQHTFGDNMKVHIRVQDMCYQKFEIACNELRWNPPGN